MLVTLRRPVAPVAALIAILALGGVAGCRGKFNILSKSEQIRIGREGSTEVEKAYPLSKNPADNAMVERIGQKLVAANSLTKWPYTFKILEDREVNALSLPGGPVYLFRGMVDLCEGDEDEMACVMAHELGHVDREHAAKQYSQGMLTNILIIFGTRGAAATAADVVSALAQLRYSREDEYESDRIGIRYAYKAGYDPNAIVRFFERMKRLEKSGTKDQIANNLRSHPLTDARIVAAKKEIANTIQKVNEETLVEYLNAVIRNK